MNDYLADKTSSNIGFVIRERETETEKQERKGLFTRRNRSINNLRVRECVELTFSPQTIG